MNGLFKHLTAVCFRQVNLIREGVVSFIYIKVMYGLNALFRPDAYWLYRLVPVYRTNFFRHQSNEQGSVNVVGY